MPAILAIKSSIVEHHRFGNPSKDQQSASLPLKAIKEDYRLHKGDAGIENLQ